MIINLNLQGKKITVVGGGQEAQKRINALLKQECQITVISEEITKSIQTLVKKKKIQFRKQKLRNANFLSTEKPFLVITTTDDKKLNKLIINKAKKNKIIIYSSDNPEESDFSNPAIVDFENLIQVAIFTGGKSPVMSKKIKEKVEGNLKKTITKNEIGQIKIQQIARTLARDKIETQIQRKAFLKSITGDNEIKQLIKDQKLKKAENRVSTMLRNWK
ncbi:MAG: bifunctional precorrin-2 dehydrogenase/sirohydrochlorin ferrochelatase [Nitrosopumilaceae archaeon]